MAYFVYLMASKRSGTLYLGVTNDVTRRVYEHKSKQNADSRVVMPSTGWFGTSNSKTYVMPSTAKKF
jgi:hypothetical protein